MEQLVVKVVLQSGTIYVHNFSQVERVMFDLENFKCTVTLINGGLYSYEDIKEAFLQSPYDYK